MNRQVNDRQLEILRWIADGCPDRDWPDHAHKHSARALQDRGLVRVSKKGGVWSADITQAGRHYIEHGDYPVPESSTRRPARSRRESAQPSAPSGLAPTATLRSPLPEPTPLGPWAPTDAQRLLSRLLSEDGLIRLPVRPYDNRLRDLVADLRKSGDLPPGQLVDTTWDGPYHRYVLLKPDPSTHVCEQVVEVPARLAKPHRVATAYKRDPHEQLVSKAHLGRAARIIHALATAVEAVGMRVDLATENGQHRASDGQFRVVMAGEVQHVRIQERGGRGGGDLPGYWTTAYKRLPAWVKRRRTRFVPTGELSLALEGRHGDGRQAAFKDGKRKTLEEQVGPIVRELMMRDFERDQQAKAAERQRAERQGRWFVVLAAAKEQALEAHRAEVLSQRAHAWSLWKERSVYVEDLRQYLSAAPSTDQPEQSAWVEWCTAFLEDHHPLRSADMPGPPPLTRDQLTPFMSDWSGDWLSI